MLPVKTQGNKFIFSLSHFQDFYKAKPTILHGISQIEDGKRNQGIFRRKSPFSCMDYPGLRTGREIGRFSRRQTSFSCKECPRLRMGREIKILRNKWGAGVG